MKKIIISCMALLTMVTANAQTPEITSWIQNTTGATGYGGYTSDIQIVQYSATWVYVSCDAIAAYPVGPWPSNPNVPAPQNFVCKFTRNPVQNTGTLTNTPLGNNGLWTNGVAIYNQKDGQYWNNATSSFTNGITTTGWNRNALVFEGISFDSCLGHPNGMGCYHNHVNPRCLYDDMDSINHSPIIGWAFDGFPVYGAYGYTNTNGTGPIKRMKSSYVLSTATTRALGPPVATYPMGNMCEDYVYTAGAGDLDVHNGRVCVTPDFPAGIYCYFVTIDNNLTPTYPYVIGPTFYGIVSPAMLGPTGSHITITETTTVYNSTTAGVLNDFNNEIKFELVPNPTADYVYIYMDAKSVNNVKAELYNSIGALVKTIDILQPSIAYTLDMTALSAGNYILSLQNGNNKVVKQIVKSK